MLNTTCAAMRACAWWLRALDVIESGCHLHRDQSRDLTPLMRIIPVPPIPYAGGIRKCTRASCLVAEGVTTRNEDTGALQSLRRHGRRRRRRWQRWRAGRSTAQAEAFVIQCARSDVGPAGIELEAPLLKVAPRRVICVCARTFGDPYAITHPMRVCVVRVYQRV